MLYFIYHGEKRTETLGHVYMIYFMYCVNSIVQYPISIVQSTIEIECTYLSFLASLLVWLHTSDNSTDWPLKECTLMERWLHCSVQERMVQRLVWPPHCCPVVLHHHLHHHFHLQQLQSPRLRGTRPPVSSEIPGRGTWWGSPTESRS